MEDRTLLAAGALDPTFGDGGKVLTAIPGMNAQASQVLIQPDSKTLAVGVSATGRGPFVLRYRTDGSLDPTFADGGKLMPEPFRDGTLVASLQADGKLIVGGNTREGPSGFRFLVGRYLPNGTLDSSFGNQGLAETALVCRVKTLAILPDGKYLAVGYVQTDIGVARYQANGQLDTSYTIRVPGQEFSAGAHFLVQPDGKIVAIATGRLEGFSRQKLSLARFNSDGSLDAGFSTNGLSIDSFELLPAGAALQPDGRIIVATSVTRFVFPRGTVTSISAFRFTATGVLDPSFGRDGQVATGIGDYLDGGYTIAGNIALASNRQFVVVGTTRSDFAATRYRPDGSLESNFGNNGTVTTGFVSGSADDALAAAFQPAGNLVVAGRFGRAGSEQLTQVALARYLGFNANERFVMQVFVDLLGREADGVGFTFWVGQLDRGFSRVQVIDAIQRSPEARTRVVRESYRRLLGPDAEQAGLDAWVAFLGQGGTAEQMETAILASDEYFRKNGRDNAGFVAALYGDVLGRGPEPGAVEAWSQVLAGGTPRGIVARAFQSSLESDRHEVRELYRRLLRREADPAGLEFFAWLLQQGTPNEQVVLVLLTSSEYAGRA